MDVKTLQRWIMQQTGRGAAGRCQPDQVAQEGLVDEVEEVRELPGVWGWGEAEHYRQRKQGGKS
jgi:hypothetical protein